MVVTQRELAISTSVAGGATLLSGFTALGLAVARDGLWDEARVLERTGAKAGAALLDSRAWKLHLGSGAFGAVAAISAIGTGLGLLALTD